MEAERKSHPYTQLWGFFISPFFTGTVIIVIGWMMIVIINNNRAFSMQTSTWDVCEFCAPFRAQVWAFHHARCCETISSTTSRLKVQKCHMPRAPVGARRSKRCFSPFYSSLHAHQKEPVWHIAAGSPCSSCSSLLHTHPCYFLRVRIKNASIFQHSGIQFAGKHPQMWVQNKGLVLIPSTACNCAPFCAVRSRAWSFSLPDLLHPVSFLFLFPFKDHSLKIKLILCIL